MSRIERLRNYSREERELLEEINREYQGSDVSHQVSYRKFQSNSAGRGRRRRQRDIELIGYGKRYLQLTDKPKALGKIDEIAYEVYGDSVSSEDLRERLLHSVKKNSL